jgi:hypothetical protein
LDCKSINREFKSHRALQFTMSDMLQLVVTLPI